MPYIEVKTNTDFSNDVEVLLKSEIAKILSSSFPGKTENWLMLNFSCGLSMYFGGSDAPCIMYDVAVFGKQSSSSYDKMTAKLCELTENKLGISADRVYVKYSEVEHWGWNNSNF